MKRNYLVLFFSTIILLITPGLVAKCQAQTRSEEDLLENETETSDETDLPELLEALRRQPVQLNQATATELTVIPFILPGFARSIVEYRQKFGYFTDLAQLAEIPELPTDFAETIRPYVTLDEARPLALHFSSRTRIKRQLDLPPEFSDSTYFNSPVKFYQRFQFQFSEQIQSGILLEKDSGENNYRDYQSFFLNWQNLPFNSQIIVGDYSFSSGLGLILGGPYGASLSADPISSANRQFQVLKPFQSVDENSAFRGLAWRADPKRVTTQIIFSHRELDASLDEFGQVRSIYTAGVHRNARELAKKDQVEEQVLGAAVLFEPNPGLKFGGTLVDFQYNRSFICTDSVRSRFAFVGKHNQLGSFSFNYIHRWLSFSGEFARGLNQTHAVTTGSTLALRDLVVNLLYRYYDPAFQSPRGRAFGQFSETPQNETGFFSAVRYRFSRRTLLQSYFDFSRQPWRSYLNTMPRESKNFYVQLNQKINPNWAVTTQYRIRRVEESATVEDAYGHEKKYLIPKISQNLRLQVDINLSAYFLIRSRIEKKWTKFVHSTLWENARLPDQQGWLVYQQVNLRLRNRLAVYGRISFFDISDYEARIYSFENDLPGNLTNRMLMHRGSRWFGMLVYNPSPWLRCALKMSTDYFDKRTEDETEVPGTKNNELAFLIDLEI